MKTKFGIVGCGFLGNIVADAWKNGLLPDYELVGMTSRTRASAEKTAETVGCAVCDDVDALLALEPEYIVETASVEAVRAMAVPVLKKGVNLVIISIGAFADCYFLLIYLPNQTRWIVLIYTYFCTQTVPHLFMRTGISKSGRI